VLERRRELALLRAVGFDGRNLSLMIVAENVLLLVLGLAAGAGCAALAIVPALAARGGGPTATLGGLLLAVAGAGLLSSIVATMAALRAPLLAALRAE
jgi:ABC-type antimicrobial peptide transport system permease subunit